MQRFNPSSTNFSEESSFGAPDGAYRRPVLSTYLWMSHGVPINLAFLEPFGRPVLILRGQDFRYQIQLVDSKILRRSVNLVEPFRYQRQADILHLCLEIKEDRFAVIHQNRLLPDPAGSGFSPAVCRHWKRKHRVAKPLDSCPRLPLRHLRES